ncbi:MAG: hypothetical protein M1830_000592 [Pleopsidium flavum]|nr:MAG: hypothetical protein M1830_000592 [Pleopsidium flavum]
MEAQQERPLQGVTAPKYQDWPAIPSTPFTNNIDPDLATAMDVDRTPNTEDRTRRDTSVLSMDDIEAAQALEGLRADFGQSPARQQSAIPTKIGLGLESDPATSTHQPEPLLSLLTSTHPLLSTAINGSLSAYSSSKSYSPRFRYGAEFVERHIGTPVASTVGTAGRISGVETGVRWWLQKSDSTDADAGNANKRRKISDTNTMNSDVEKGFHGMAPPSYAQRGPSDLSLVEALPAYDDHRSPSYEEHGAVAQADHPRPSGETASNSNWQTRLMMSTSGLGVAMSEESLRSLKYCLTWLRWANGHLSKVLISLRDVLEEWERSRSQLSQPSSEPNVGADHQHPSSQTQPTFARDQAAVSQRIQALKGEVLQTLKKVVDIVSKYAGGALPENARILVRRHLTSLPQRFRIASTSTAPTGSSQPASETVTSAHRVMVLAKEGLDMMAQVSGVLDGTIVSAEGWCDRLGRRRSGQIDPATGAQIGNKDPHSGQENDVRMSGQDEKRG